MGRNPCKFNKDSIFDCFEGSYLSLAAAIVIQAHADLTMLIKTGSFMSSGIVISKSEILHFFESQYADDLLAELGISKEKQKKYLLAKRRLPMELQETISRAECAISEQLKDLKPKYRSVAEREIARCLLRGNLLGRAAPPSNPISIQLADEIWELSLSLFQYRQLDKSGITDFIALLLDHMSHMMEDLTDG